MKEETFLNPLELSGIIRPPEEMKRIELPQPKGPLYKTVDSRRVWTPQHSVIAGYNFKRLNAI